MELKDFKVGMKIKDIHDKRDCYYSVDFITKSGNILVSWDDNPNYNIRKGEVILCDREFPYHTPYVEKAKIKLYHYLYIGGNIRGVNVLTTKAPWPAYSYTILKQWEEEVEYEVPTGNT